MFEQWWNKRRRTADESPATAKVPYVDQTVERLEVVRRERTSAGAECARLVARWDGLTTRTDPEAHAVREEIAPTILALQARVDTLAAEQAVAEDTIRTTKRLVAEFEAKMAASEVRWAPLLARIAEVNAAAAFSESSELGRLANRLHVATGDRQFRKLACDPYGALLTTLSESLRVAERQKFARQHANRVSDLAKTGTDAR